MTYIYKRLMWPAVVVLFGILLMAGCNDENRSSRVSSEGDSLFRPDSEVRGAKIYLYERGKITTEIASNKIVKFEQQDSTVAYELNILMLDSTGLAETTVTGDSGIIRENTGLINIYGNVDINNLASDGHVTSHIVGDSGRITEDHDIMNIYGNVVVVTDDSTRLETEYLKYDATTEKIKTDAFVKITKRGDVLTGWGLDADDQLTRIKILNQVSGTISDPESKK